MRKKETEIHIRLVAEDKDRLTYLAGIQQKTMSQFLLDSALNPPSIIAEPVTTPDYSADIAEINKQLFILVRLVLFAASSEQRHAEEDVIKFYDSTFNKATKIYGEKG